ncbi:DUF7059 domain-containing protein [Nocardioides caldifontis]|uniref:DUF7059 domain-containing protein n=1 Tax=Nocardioides caldifontis TaxID=2588938 RepID=UPI0030843C17
MELLRADLVPPLREALTSAGFTYDGVAAALGPTAHAALGRNETTPGLRRTAGGTPLETLVRLWPLQSAVDVHHAEEALPGLVDPLCAAGLLERSVGSVRARVDVRPYASDERDWWVVSDLTPGLDGTATRVGADHVLGISSASSSLAQLTVRTPVARALDLGTGCGVQSLHLTDHAGHVVATDVNRRALAMSRLNAALNEVDIDVREGSLYDPVRGEAFDLLVTNPPFVVSPGTGELLVYRDSGLPGDEMVRRVVTGAPAHLAPGGLAQVLANWVHVDGLPWEERLSGWLEGTGCDAWVVQREVADPAQSSSGSVTPATTGRPTTSSGTTRGSGGSRSRASPASGSGGSTCAGPTANRPCGSRSGRTTSSSPSAPRSASGPAGSTRSRR